MPDRPRFQQAAVERASEVRPRRGFAYVPNSVFMRKLDGLPTFVEDVLRPGEGPIDVDP